VSLLLAVILPLWFFGKEHWKRAEKV